MKHSLVLLAMLAPAALVASAQTPAAPLPSAPDAPAAHAAEPAPPGASSIAVIAFQVAVGNTNEFQRNFADLQKKYDPKRQEIKALSDDLDARTKALQTDADKLSVAERAARATEIDDKKKKLDRSAQDAENDYRQEMQQLYAATAQKFYDVMSAYAQQNGYTLVLDMANEQTPVLYAMETTDITKPVVQAYNVKSGVPAPPAPAAGATPRTPGATAPRVPRSTAPKTPPAK